MSILMKPIIVILAGLLIYQSYRLNKAEFENIELKRDNKHLLGQLQKANDQVIEWNKNYLCKDFAKRNGLSNLLVN